MAFGELPPPPTAAGRRGGPVHAARCPGAGGGPCSTPRLVLRLPFPCTFSDSWPFCSTFKGFLQLGLVILSLTYFSLARFLISGCFH